MERQDNSQQRAPTTVLVGLTLPGTTPEQTKEHLDELAALAYTRGIKPVGTFVQRLDKPHGKTWVGTGKVEEIAAFVQAHQVDSVLFDDELSPAKVNNLASRLACKVWDRTMLILEIFKMRAKTGPAQKQVELAACEYLLPRLKGMWTHLSRQKGGGGAGMQGTGEKELETDKRVMHKKIHLLKQELSALERQTITQRKQRKNKVKVALVGYTNAGKSTLMRLLTKEDVLVENKLFATLTTTVRKVVINNTPFILSDTVGFIRKLPHTLIESFKTTLTEIRDADLLLHVVDFSHPNFAQHIQVVNQTLQQLKAHHIPTILIFNKIDQVPLQQRLGEGSITTNKKEAYDMLSTKYTKLHKCPVVIISASTPQNTPALHQLLYKHVATRYQQLYPQNTLKHTS